MKTFRMILTAVLATWFAMHESNVSAQSAEIVEVSGDITAEVNWTNDKIYLLKGYVRVQDGGVLNIEPGTLIKGERSSKGTLIIQMGGQIYAEGTPEQPIIFTSNRAVGSRQPGDWGGVVICGRAPNNITAATGQTVELEGGYGAIHGGNDPDDNSGVLRYVRIEFAGIPINPNEEVNSLTMGSVGSGTTIEYVQCVYGLDDAFEWFGGTVNARNLVAHRNLDDDLDVDLGYSGKVQFILAKKDPSLADQSGSNGYEVDNNGSGSLEAPFTSPVFANVSVIGPKGHFETPISLQYQNAMHLRRSNQIKIYNSFFTGYPNGLLLDGANTSQHAQQDELQLRNVVLAGVENWGDNGFGQGYPNAPRGYPLDSANNAQVTEWFYTQAYNNQILDKWQDAGIDPDVFELSNPSVLPEPGSMLLDGARWDNTPHADDFFEEVDYIGAFGDEDWTTGWVNWNPQITNYDEPPTGISGMDDADITHVAAYPNPASEYAHVQFYASEAANINVSVYSLTGEEVLRRESDYTVVGLNELVLPVHGLSTGTYIARLTSGKTAQSVKIRVERGQ